MKATELMIGDWVAYKHKYMSDPLFCEVISIDAPRGELVLRHLQSEKIDEFGNKDYKVIKTRYEDVYPIPLTAEILEKNGLKYEVDYGGYHRSILGSHSKDNEPLICVQWNPQEKISQWEVSNKSGILTGVVAYGYTAITVHELQHILRMVGLNEMADNFKV